MEVQSILFNKECFDIKGAKKWLKSHKFQNKKTDETDEYYRFRQKDPNLFFEDSFRTIKNENIMFVIAVPIVITKRK